ncbi:MAG: leucine-rich repeat protein [Muribaculaceae bacterium]|nr:leucine-rich repeat protein [Muribaculaceae bacterium]
MRILKLLIFTILLTSIPSWAAKMSFSDGKDLKYSLTYTIQNSESFARVSATSKDDLEEIQWQETVICPEDNKSYPVTMVAGSGFSRCNKLTEVTIPGFIKLLGNNAFSHCDNLESVVIMEGVTTVAKSGNIESGEVGYADYDQSAFAFCPNLKSIKIPSTFTVIPRMFLVGCTSLTSVDIAEGVTDIAERAFSNTSSLKSLYLPSSIKYVGSTSFSNSGIEELLFGSQTVLGKSINDFFNLPSLIKIGYPALEENKNFTLPEEYKDAVAISYDPQTSIVKNGFVYGPEYQSIIYAPINIESYVVQPTVMSIEDYAFANCINLGDLYLLGQSHTSPLAIGKNAFQAAPVTNMTMLRTFTFSENKTPFPDLINVVIMDGVSIIAPYSFAGSKLTQATVPSSVSEIGEAAFATTTLKEFTLNDGVNTLTMEPVYNGSYPMKAEVYIGRPIDGTPFKGSSITSVIIGNHIETIPENAFEGCLSLKTAYIGSNVKTIGNKAFYSTQLSDILIPMHVEKIGDDAFTSPYLQNVIIGHSIKDIGSNAFGSNKLDNLRITSFNPPLCNYRISMSTIHLEKDSHDAYRNEYTWSIPSNVTYLTRPEYIEFDGPQKFIGRAGDTFQLSASLKPQDIHLPHVYWSSTNPEIATVDRNGLVTLHQDMDEAEILNSPMKAPDATPFRILAESLYTDGPTVAINPQTGEMSGISDVVKDNNLYDIDMEAPFDVYNLSGVRVGSDLDVLSPGIYILKQNNTVKKVSKH